MPEPVIANVLLPNGTTRRLVIPEAWPTLMLPIYRDTVADGLLSAAPDVDRWEMSRIDYDPDRREAWYA